MHTKRPRQTPTYPQSEGNLALSEESLAVVQEPNPDLLSTELRVVQGGMAVEETEAHALAPATGMINGIGFSLVFWSLIVLVTYVILLSI